MSMKKHCDVCGKTIGCFDKRHKFKTISHPLQTSSKRIRVMDMCDNCYEKFVDFLKKEC